MTGNEQIYTTDLGRADRANIPVNLLYPADYPNRPAIMLEELISPSQALEALDRIAPATESASVGRFPGEAEKNHAAQSVLARSN